MHTYHVLIIGLLFCQAVLADICNKTYTTPSEIVAVSLQYQKLGFQECHYFIQAPQSDENIILNFTQFHGFHVYQNSPPWQHNSSNNKDSPNMPNRHDGEGTVSQQNCAMPKIQVMEVAKNKSTMLQNVICYRRRKQFNTQVFHFNSSFIKITFQWKAGQNSGFSLNLGFLNYQESCDFRCGDLSCLPDSKLLCNGERDCTDGSDEQNCSSLVPSAPSTADDSGDTSDGASSVSNIIETVVIIIVVMLTCVVMCCIILRYHRILRGAIHRRSTHDISSSSEHSQLHPSSPTEVTYVPHSPQMQPTAFPHSLGVQRQIRFQPVQGDLNISGDLPPRIPISKDGEEGYISAKGLTSIHAASSDPRFFRPPPNKTIHDGESPPPYRSQSVGLLDGRHHGGRTPARMVRDSNGTPTVVRCNSLSYNNNNCHLLKHKNSPDLKHSPCPTGGGISNSAPGRGQNRGRNISAGSSGGGTVGSPDLDFPPDYSEVIANPEVFQDSPTTLSSTSLSSSSLPETGLSNL